MSISTPIENPLVQKASMNAIASQISTGAAKSFAISTYNEIILDIPESERFMIIPLNHPELSEVASVVQNANPTEQKAEMIRAARDYAATQTFTAFFERAGRFKPLEPKVEEEEENIFNIAANIFRLKGSTALGADPQEKVLVSSGLFSQEQLDTLAATGHIIELVSETELTPVETTVTVQEGFIIINGVKFLADPEKIRDQSIPTREKLLLDSNGNPIEFRDIIEVKLSENLAFGDTLVVS